MSVERDAEDEVNLTRCLCGLRPVLSNFCRSLWSLRYEICLLDSRILQAEAVAAGVADIPAQLMFVHQGQRDVKEVHWHPQIPGLVATTAADGLNVFRTANWGGL